jgi:hypothetical protein
MKNNTWKLVELPPKKKPIGCKWVFQTKFKSNGLIDKYKAKLVAKGCTKIRSYIYLESFVIFVSNLSPNLPNSINILT